MFRRKPPPRTFDEQLAELARLTRQLQNTVTVLDRIASALLSEITVQQANRDLGRS